MQEIWRPIPNYEGLYEVSNLGRIKSLRTNKLMKPHIINRGYYDVCLSKNGVAKHYLVHRLVCEAFCEKPEGKDVVDHINGRKTDNRSQNLRWTSQKENVRRGNRVRPVVRGDGKYYETLQSVTEDGFNAPSVCECCQGKFKTHHGYEWAYVM